MNDWMIGGRDGWMDRCTADMGWDGMVWVEQDEI